MTTLSLEEINKLDIVDFLESQKIYPAKIVSHNYWYLSPLPDRAEKTPSFKVNRKLNRWWDFGLGEGSTLVDFGIRYFNCTIRELKEKLASPYQNVPRHQQPVYEEEQQKIQIIQTTPIRSFYLIRYLWERRIPLDVARLYCIEAQYTFGPKPYYAIGFRSDAGGYELRNKFHKYSTRPKSPTLITNHSDEIAIFEGFFDMLTFVSFTHTPSSGLPDLLVLNSVTFFQDTVPLLAGYKNKHLFLDNDPTGKKHTGIALALNAGYVDHSALYTGYNDLNEWVCNIGKARIPDLNRDNGKGL